MIIGEEGSGSADLGTHVADRSHTCARERFYTWSVIFDNRPGSTFHRQDSSNLQDDVYKQELDLAMRSSMILTLWRRPAIQLPVQVDTNDLRRLELPWNVGHDIHCVRTTHTASDHTETTGIRGMRIRANHQ